MSRTRWFSPCGMALLAAALGLAVSSAAQAQGLVPGTGSKVDNLGDDFEDAQWSFKLNYPKSSYEEDKNSRDPSGYSANGRWFEGPMRGMPDYMRRVPTPAGGLPGSEGSLLIRTLNSGIPNRLSYKMEQDDLIGNFHGKVIPFWRNPSVVTRVFVPPFDTWEQRAGSTFAFRAACLPENPRTTKEPVENPTFFGPKTKDKVIDVYWPGLIIDYQPAKGETPAKAFLRVRANSNGADYTAKEITQDGWWTLGLSFTPDGRCHTYAHHGLEPLTDADRLSTEYPYGFRGKSLQAFFFCSCNRFDGKSWSTPWVVDDPTVFAVPQVQQARTQPTQKRSR